MFDLRFKNLEDIDFNNIYISDIAKLIWLNINRCILIISLISLLSVFFALSLPNIYQSSAVLVPKSSNDNLNSKLSSFSTLSTFAGVEFRPGEVSKSQEAIKKVESLDFFSEYFLPNINLQDLFAVKEWVYSENKIIYDKDIYDVVGKRWVRKVKHPQSPEPSMLEAYKRYKKILNISEDKKSFVRISIDHQSPHVAKEWLEIIINNVNESMRLEDKISAQNSIDYLNKESELTNIASLKDAISNLLEVQLQTLMLASSEKEYIFKILDSPFIAEEKSSPSRALICILAFIFSIFMSIITILITSFIKTRNLKN